MSRNFFQNKTIPWNLLFKCLLPKMLLFLILTLQYLIYIFKLQRYFFLNMWKICWMKLLHFGLKIKLLIRSYVEFSFCNFNLYFNNLFWILKLFYLNILNGYYGSILLTTAFQFRGANHCDVIRRFFKRKMCLSRYIIDKNCFNNIKE